MGSVFRIYAADLSRLRSMLGSGEEAFCARVLRTIPEEAGRRGLAADADLLKAWKRSVTALVLGEPGEALASKDPFDEGSVTEASPGQSLGFASILEGIAEPGLGGVFSGEVPEGLSWRPLFGLRSGSDLVRWGALHRDELATRVSHPIFVPIRSQGLDVLGLTRPA